MAVGIGLVFGVLRLVNFAYGQLVMAGAFALALASQWGWPLWAGIVLCFAVVLVLSMLMDRLVFRPLRGHSPAVMLVATFAVAFLLQSIALLWFGPLGKIATSLALPQPAGDDLAASTSARSRSSRSSSPSLCLVALALLLERTTIGLHMRASSMDFQTARMLGVRANRVIAMAVLVSGALAAVVAVMLTVQNPLVTPDFALRDTIIVLAGVVLGGHEPADPGDARRLRDRLRERPARRRAADEPEPVPADVPLRRGDPRAARPAGRHLHARAGGGARMRRLARAAGAAQAPRCS